MKVILARGVNDAYYFGLKHLKQQGVAQNSRNGSVIVAPTPVTTVYANPMERVLFNAARDANPFFHVMESIWMLAGWDDARWLDQFVKDFSSRFAEPGGTMHGAYGYRWRRAFGFDQLNAIVKRLRVNPDDRQAVLQMWDARDEEIVDQTGCNDLNGDWKDRPCNTTAYFRVRQLVEPLQPNGLLEPMLDLTVCCRSNDVLYGAYGANVVHFSVLQEYVAARLGVGVGTYYQISNNFHVYQDILNKIESPVGPETYDDYEVRPRPMVTVPDKFDEDVRTFMEWTKDYEHGDAPYGYHNSWFSNTAEPLFAAAERWRAKEREHALEIIDDTDVFDMAPDWWLAARLWITRRMNKVKG